MPTFKGILAFDPSDAVMVGMIPVFEPIARDDEPRGGFDASQGNSTYEAYAGRSFSVFNFTYVSNPLDLEHAVVDPDTGILSKRFDFVIEFTWYKNQFFEAGITRTVISVIAVGNARDKKANTNSVFYVNASDSESISVVIQPEFPNIDMAEAALVLNYDFDVGFSRSSRRLLPANQLRIYNRVLGNFSGRPVDYSGLSAAQAASAFSGIGGLFTDLITGFDFNIGVIYLPMVKTGWQIANAGTVFNMQFSISQEDIDNALVMDDVFGIPVSMGSGVGKTLCVTRQPVSIPEFQKRRVGYGVTDPWEGYPTGGIDGEYVRDANPLHFAVQPESAVEDKFFGAINAPPVRYGGNDSYGAFLNCPRFSYTRVYNSFIIVYIPKAEAIDGFQFYVTAHASDDVSFFAARADDIFVTGTIGSNNGASAASRGYGDFAFAPKSYYVNSGLMIKNWMKKKIITENNILISDPLTEIPAWPSGVVSEFAQVISFAEAVTMERPVSDVANTSVMGVSTMRLIKTRIRANFPRFARFPLGYFAAADSFAIDFAGTSKIDGGIAYIDSNGNVDIIIPKSQIRDQEWFKSFFGNTVINTQAESDYAYNIGNDNGFVYLFYDVSAICSSLLEDNSKIPYDHRLARALTQVSQFNVNDPTSGVGICQLNFLIKRSTGAWQPREDSMIKSAPNPDQTVAIRYYFDLSSAVFDTASPMPRSMQVEVVNSTIDIGGSTGSINAVFEWQPVTPVNLKSNGRIYYERTDPISGSSGQNSEVNAPYISTTPTSGKISSCIDYGGVHGALISSGSFGGDELRSMHIDGMLENHKRRSYVNSISFPSGDVRIDGDDVSKPGWYGFSVDQIPIMPRGAYVLRQKNISGSAITDPALEYRVIKSKSKLTSRNISFYDYQDGEWVRLLRQEKYIQFTMPDDTLIESMDVKLTGTHRAAIPLYKNFANITFSSGSTDGIIASDAVLYRDVIMGDTVSVDANGTISTTINISCKVPYYGGRVTIFGGALNDLLTAEASVSMNVASKNSINRYKIQAMDAGIAITSDGKYVSVVAVQKQTATAIDLLLKDDENHFWKRIQNVVQPFAGESFNSIMIRSSHNNNKIFLSFALNDCMFIKPIDIDWLEDASDDGIISIKERFRLPNKKLYGMSGKAYGALLNISDVREAYRKNKVRIKPAFLMYGSNSQFLELEKTQYQNAVQDQFDTDSGDEVSPRLEISPEAFSADPEIRSLYTQSSSSSYSFEVMPDGSLICASIRDGGMVLRRSTDSGRSWRSVFSQFKSGASLRPIKFLKSDKGSYIKELDTAWKYYAGSCPAIESISTAIDLFGQKMAFAYSIRGMIFIQEIPISMILSDCIDYLKRTFTTDQRDDIEESNAIYPLLVAGSVPSEYELPLLNRKCDFAWRMAGPLSRNNISALGNIALGSKAPAMIYLSSGALRLHFEGSRGEIRAVTVTASTVRGDYIP
jgi:hypothetical protein